MARGSVEDILKQHTVIGIDTMVFIYHFEGDAKYSQFTKNLFEAVESGKCRGITSTLTLMETLVKPKETRNSQMRDDYFFALTTFPNLTMRALDTQVAETAAELRASLKLRPPDAIQIATSIVEGATVFITNDSGLKKVKGPEVVLMSDYI